MGRKIIEATTPYLERVDFFLAGEEDFRLIVDFYRGLDKETVFLRFLHALKNFEEHVKRILLNPNSYVIYAVIPSSGEVVGVAEAVKIEEGVAEAALVVKREYRKRGIGGILLYSLARILRNNGVEKIRGYIHVFNDVAKIFLKKYNGVLEEISEDTIVGSLNVDNTVRIMREEFVEKDVFLKEKIN